MNWQNVNYLTPAHMEEVSLSRLLRMSWRRSSCGSECNCTVVIPGKIYKLVTYFKSYEN